MRRREFITLLGSACAVWPLTARAQPSKMPVIGFLDIQSASGFERYVGAFHQGLKETGFVEGQNLAIEYRWAEDHPERLPALAADLVRRQVSVIFAGAGSVALVAKAASATIPIVFQVGLDPVRNGLVASLSRPGGNVTGFSNVTPDLTAKRLELLHQIVPGAKTVAALLYSGSPVVGTTRTDLQEAARALGLELIFLSVNNDADIDEAFPGALKQQAGAMFLTDTTLFNNRREKLVALAARYQMPAIYTFPEFAKAGGLISYASSLVDGYRQSGAYVGRVLKGEKPADLPVLQPTKFELVINIKTAKALGLTVPPSLLATADEVIE